MKRVISSESAVYGTEICFKRQKMIDGEYDLKKLFGIDFLNKDSIPDRTFLKEVTFTKNIYLGLNKVLQSFYRIQKRIEDGAESLEEIIGPDYVNINFIGEPGTGKSFALKVICAVLGIPMRVEAFSGESGTDKFLGVSSIAHGEIRFNWTAVPMTHRDGGVIALEEINQMKTDRQMALSQAVVSPFILEVDNYMDTYRNPFTVYVNLFNVGTEGSKPFNEAYLNRFSTTFVFEKDDRETIISKLHQKLGYNFSTPEYLNECSFVPRALEEVDFEVSVDILENVKNYLNGDMIARNDEAKTISERQSANMLVEIQNGIAPKDAAILTFVNTLACIDLELAQEVKEEVIDIFPWEYRYSKGSKVKE
ncbi:MAG: AAA family ATPase [Clostridiales bacterium]|nr:AAA family ATPase [Clostridiales bacterium]MBS5877072.1 AAA family ATPase [Clostridiales bacterium]MDU0939083.1 AAA family ATPase [Clostridiales bacterium]MDU1041782.1 AAA family ATPase [Clostridiales bacterium]MDU3489603.1 AAA family ATPase [Clostridiales bacterium]